MYKINISIGQKVKNFTIRFPDSQEINMDEITSVYFHHPNPPNFGRFVTEVDREFAERESIEVLRSIWRMIPEKKWLNHPINLWRANNKIEQLIAASNFGFDIPETFMSSDKDSVSAFINKDKKDVIAKAVKHGFINRDGKTWVASTQRLPVNYLENFDTFAEIPTLYQHEIKKIYDIRVVVVGEKIFASAIHSQNFKETEIDWRVGDIVGIELCHEKIDLPKAVENKCKKLMKYFSLQYSSMDFVFAEDKKYYFLELNPNGQWAWIEQIVGYPIRDAIIDNLS
jgi:glutathione synthase/RimK-type ligase-like ATP-grasp enzyme